MTDAKPHPTGVSVRFLVASGQILEEMYGPRLCGAEFQDLLDALGDVERRYYALAKDQEEPT